LPEIDRLAAAFNDPSIVELIINDDGAAYVERPGSGLENLGLKVAPQDVVGFLKALVGDISFGPQRPFADLSAPDGSRIHVLASPIVRGGLAVTIRKRPGRRPSLDELAEGGTLTPNCASFLKLAVAQRKNILVVGGTSSGKTTMLNALCALVDPADRILVVEDTPELTLPQPHVVYMKTRLRDLQGLPDVTLRDLIANTLRMRPDRIVVGEVRGPEALDMLQAMNVGQEGVMGTLHASSCREALQRLETLVLMAGLDMPLKAVRGNVALAIDVIVFLARLSDGSRRVLQVAEVTGLEVENILLNDLFKMESRKSDAALAYTLRATGSIPRFYDQLRQQGFEPPLDLFRD
jgi:pilus assembly protein CpaF